jgi:outer membrane protein insertion porin family
MVVQMKYLLFILIFSFSCFANFKIDSVSINCPKKVLCTDSNEIFYTLKRDYVDQNHFERLIKVYSLTSGVKKFRYKVNSSDEVSNNLEITWEPKQTIESIEYQFDKGALPIPTILPLREGDFFDLVKVAKVQQTLLEIFKSEGYPQSQITYSFDTIKDKSIKLTFQINLGAPLLVKDIKISTPLSFLTKAANQKFSEFRGRPYNSQDVRKEIESFKETMIDYGMYSAKIQFKSDQNDKEADLFITITDTTRLAFYIELKNSDDQYVLSLKDKLKDAALASKKSLSKTTIMDLIIKDLSNRGFLSSEVLINQTKSTLPDGGQLFSSRIIVKEGTKARLSNVFFKGNNIIPSKTLRRAFYSNASSQASDGVYDDTYYKNFLTVIKELYIQKGFVNILLESPEIIFEKSKNKIDLVYRIREGVRAKIEVIKIIGLNPELKNDVRDILKIKVGDAFDPIALKVKVGAIKTFLYERGYFYFEFYSDRRNTLVKYNEDNTKVTLNFKFFQGEKYSVGDIFIAGNFKTRSKVIKRELSMNPGELLRASDIAKSQTNILSTGLFSSVVITPIKNSSSNADILISVKEKDYGLVEFAPGVRTDLGPKVSAKVTYSNIDGLHKQISVRAQVNQRFNLNSLDEKRRKDQSSLIEYITSVNYQENYFFDLPLSFDSSISSSRQRFFSFDADIQKVSYTFSSDLSDWLNLSLTQELEVISQYNATVERESGKFQIGSLTPAVTMDFRNNRINPTSGAFFSLSTEFANPAFFSQENEEIVIDYYKVLARNRVYIPYPNGTLALSLSTGVQKNLAVDKKIESDGSIVTEGYIPNIKVFRLSGMDNVRGYEDNEINRLVSGEDISEARVDDKAYMLNLKIEPRVFLSDSTMLGIFYDAGRVFVGEYDLSRLRSSVGFSFKYLTPVGSLDFDYGIKLLRKRDSDGRLESPGRLHVSIGFF